MSTPTMLLFPRLNIMRDSLRVLLLLGVDAACGGVRGGRAKGVRALTGFGRNSLLSSLVVSANVCF
jgi:hypothetical protein